MSATFRYLVNNPRKKKIQKCKTYLLNKNPQRKGICAKIYTTTPKKPNSGIKKVAKIALRKVKRMLIAYIPGIGHSLAKYNKVLIRGGKVPDIPGMKYTLIRGVYDFKGLLWTHRRTKRSKYGVKNLERMAAKKITLKFVRGQKKVYSLRKIKFKRQWY
jgi:small subunit ribosomal protein S12